MLHNFIVLFLQKSFEEASSHDWINMTKFKLEHDQKIWQKQTLTLPQKYADAVSLDRSPSPSSQDRSGWEAYFKKKPS